MINSAELAEILSNDSCYTYRFDVTDDRIDNDIVDKNGYNYTAASGLTSPCSFDEIIRRSFDTERLDMEYTLESTTNELSCASFINAFNDGRRRIEATVFFPRKNIYNRLTYFLTRDGGTGHIIAHVVCQDVSATEIDRLSKVETAQRKLVETDGIISDAGIGVWKIVMFDNEKPRMYGSARMNELLGIKDPETSPEQVYEIWHSGIKSSALPIVDQGVSDMRSGNAEITYAWHHPEHGEIFVRCGGTGQLIPGKGYIFRGYHSDVTEIINSDMRQKQLLADALEATKKQKAMLQEALDNYKQADYDRRTDFLTGLRNRQDMFELLNDGLSGKREKIKAVFMMDIDNFKMLNDNYGHSAGDDCLRRIGSALLSYARENNMYFYRYGGEEMLGISFTDADFRKTADDIVKLISGLKITRSDVPAGVVTVSLGYTSDCSQPERMIDKADKAMYQAKADGKNRADCFEELFA